jgi:hypothetical protein
MVKLVDRDRLRSLVQPIEAVEAEPAELGPRMCAALRAGQIRRHDHPVDRGEQGARLR